MVLDILDGAGVAKTIKTTVSAGDHVTHHNVDSSALPTGAATEATLATMLTLSGFQARVPTLGQKAMSGSVSITPPTDHPVFKAPSTATHTNVAGAAADTQLLASNGSRLGFVVYNDSSAILYLKYGTGASSTSFITALAAGASWTDPFQWTGVVNGQWASATGSARVTEIT